MKNRIGLNAEYKKWLRDIKSRVRPAQIKAVVQVNTELLNLYWGLGADIIKKQLTSKWGDGLILQLSKDLMTEFPDVKGFSLSNLKYMKQWYLFYSRTPRFSQQLVGQIKLFVNSEFKTPAIGWRNK